MSGYAGKLKGMLACAAVTLAAVGGLLLFGGTSHGDVSMSDAVSTDARLRAIAEVGDPAHAGDDARPRARGKASSDDRPGRDEIVAAALAAYDDVLACRDFLHVKQAVSALSEKWSNDIEDVPEWKLEPEMESLERARNVLERDQERCAGVTQDALDRELIRSSLELGSQGYLPAQACFVETAFVQLRDHYRDNPTDRELYLRNAPGFLVSLLEAGNDAEAGLGMMLLGYTYGDTVPSWLSDMGMPAPYLVYRAQRLQAWRVAPRDRDRIDRVLRELEQRYRFSDEQVAESKAWARRVFAERYANAPVLETDGPRSSCQPPSTLDLPQSALWRQLP